MADIGGGYRSPSFRIEITLLSAAIALFLLAMLGVWFSQYETRRSNVWVEQAISLREVADELAIIGSTAGNGATPAFDKITPLLRSGDEAITALRDGNAARGISPLSGSSREPLTDVEQSWLLSKRHAQGMASRQSAWVSAASAVAGVEAAARDALGRYESSVEWLARNNAPAPQLLLVAGQLTRLERISSLSQSVLKGNGGLAATLRQLDSEVQSFTRSNQILMGKGPDELRMGMLEVQNTELKGLLGTIDSDFQAAAAGVTQARSLSDELTALQTAAAALAPAAAQLSDLVSELNSQVMMGSESGQTRSLFIYGTGLAAVALLIGFIVMSFRNAKKRQRELEERDSRQQGAILNLLDEITNLSDGDLTVDVTVTEDFTGAIADSINYTVDTLRRLVGTINNTSVEIAAAATSTQDTAQKMNQASERQAREITNVTTIIAQTAESLTQMAARAEQISQDAAVSVDVAHNGAVTVGRTIQGMTAVREQIQETAKRIKRLGESSQEIGNIIEFINDISDQTNTLALNASIQAAMAGEAGRGFAVVADEVQRLAERAGSATRQIETLVKTIQADTAEAIISMERSTSTVVTGARNAEEAGQALTRIESTSTEVARLIQDIAAAARSQSAQATRIAGQMQAIRDIAVQTSGSSGQTARAVGELTTLSEKLRESVAGFKLPADVALMTSIDLSSAA